MSFTYKQRVGEAKLEIDRLNRERLSLFGLAILLLFDALLVYFTSHHLPIPRLLVGVFGIICVVSVWFCLWVSTIRHWKIAELKSEKQYIQKGILEPVEQRKLRIEERGRQAQKFHY